MNEEGKRPERVKEIIIPTKAVGTSLCDALLRLRPSWMGSPTPLPRMKIKTHNMDFACGSGSRAGIPLEKGDARRIYCL